MTIMRDPWHNPNFVPVWCTVRHWLHKKLAVVWQQNKQPWMYLVCQCGCVIISSYISVWHVIRYCFTRDMRLHSKRTSVNTYTGGCLFRCEIISYFICLLSLKIEHCVGWYIVTNINFLPPSSEQFKNNLEPTYKLTFRSRNFLLNFRTPCI